MITENMCAVYGEANRLAGYGAIKEGVLAALAGSEQLSGVQRAAIIAVAEKLPTWPPTDGRIDDGPLRGIMEVTWPDIGLSDDDADALVPEQRVGILYTVMAVCVSIIEAERGRLAGVTALDTSFPINENQEEGNDEEEPEDA